MRTTLMVGPGLYFCGNLTEREKNENEKSPSRNGGSFFMHGNVTQR